MNSLALQVQEVLKRDPHAGDLYVFRGRRGHLIKILWHDGIGMSLYVKRLERGWFLWPSPGKPALAQAGGIVAISAAQWPTCSTGSTGGTRFAPGAQRWLAESLPLDLIRGCDRLTHPVVE
jgi:transposase